MNASQLPSRYSRCHPDSSDLKSIEKVTIIISNKKDTVLVVHIYKVYHEYIPHFCYKFTLLKQNIHDFGSSSKENIDIGLAIYKILLSIDLTIVLSGYTRIMLYFQEFKINL